MVTFKGINHLALITGDMEKTTVFYRDVLGMPLVAALAAELEGVPMRHYFFKLGEGNTIAFFEWKDRIEEFHKPAGEPASGRIQFDHLSFNVADEESLLALKARLESKGVDVTRVVDHGFVQSVYFTDPNGIALEASYWVRDATVGEPDYDDPFFFKDPDPVPALRSNKSPAKA